MSAQHTPGPWVIDEEDLRQAADDDTVFSLGVWAGGGDNRVMVTHVSAFGLHSEIHDGVEHVSPTDPTRSQLEEAKANARLIAAAPELLAELQNVREIIAAWNQSFIETVTNPKTGLIDDPEDVLTAESDQDVLNGIDAAITKATGAP